MEKNRLQLVKEKMASIKAARDAKIAEIALKQDAARKDLQAAEAAMQSATEIMDVDRYADGSKKRERAQAELEMLSGIADRIMMQENISEQESDKVVDSLLEYELQLEAEFKAAVKEPMKKLNAICEAYRGAVRDTEATISAWTRDVHRNFSTRGGTLYFDPELGRHTDRSPVPVPVHPVDFIGCDEALRLAAYLRNDKQLFDEESI